MKKSRLFLNILGALGVGIMIPGVVIGTVSCSNNSTSQNQNSSVYLENISDIEKGGDAQIVTDGVAVALQNSIKNGTQEQQKQMVINLLQNKFKFYEDMTDAEKQTIKYSQDRHYKKSDLSNVQSVTIDQNNPNSVTIAMEKMSDTEKKQYIYSPYTKDNKTSFKETSIAGDNQKITIALTPENQGTSMTKLNDIESNTKKAAFIKNKVFKSVDELSKYDLKDNNITSYFGYVDVGNGKCSLYLIALDKNASQDENNTENIAKGKVTPSPYVSKPNIQYYIDTTWTDVDKNKVESNGYQIKINPIQIATKFII